MKDKKAQVTIYIFWLIAAILIVIVTAIFAPTGTLFTTKMIKQGESILAKANDDISSIQNNSIRAEINNSIGSALSAGKTNIEITSDMFKYTWVIILVLSAIVAFLFTRQIVEFNRPGGIV